jgi:uncharacterized protein YacL
MLWRSRKRALGGAPGVLDFIVFRTIFILILSASAGYFRPAGQPFWPAALVGAALGVLAIVLERRIARISLQRLIGVVFGVVAGLICAALVSLILGHAGAETSNELHFVQIVCMLLFAYVGAVTGASKGELLNLSALGGIFGSDAEGRTNQQILDTSVIIDGRIADIADTGFLDGVLVVPQFVLHELQMVADSADSMKRNRGRRGLDVLQRIQKMAHLKVRIVNDDFPHVHEVDMKLIELAKLYKCKIMTNDFNLNKVAHVRGVEVLNINELANSLKPIVLPGELMRVFILKEGKEYNQGVAYLDDGTMVVVDNARRMISKTIDISVTSVLQTTAGKMIFGKYDDRTHGAAAGASATAAPGAVERRDTPPRREQTVGEN